MKILLLDWIFDWFDISPLLRVKNMTRLWEIHVLDIRFRPSSETGVSDDLWSMSRKYSHNINNSPPPSYNFDLNVVSTYDLDCYNIPSTNNGVDPLNMASTNNNVNPLRPPLYHPQHQTLQPPLHHLRRQP